MTDQVGHEAQVTAFLAAAFARDPVGYVELAQRTPIAEDEVLAAALEFDPDLLRRAMAWRSEEPSAALARVRAVARARSGNLSEPHTFALSSKQRRLLRRAGQILQRRYQTT